MSAGWPNSASLLPLLNVLRRLGGLDCTQLFPKELGGVRHQRNVHLLLIRAAPGGVVLIAYSSRTLAKIQTSWQDLRHG